MRKKSIAVMSAVALLMLLLPGNQTSAETRYVTHYTVYYQCIVSPDMRGQVVGEWTVDCQGNWSGWGMKPTDGCTYFTETQGDQCGPIGPGDPPCRPGGCDD